MFSNYLKTFCRGKFRSCSVWNIGRGGGVNCACVMISVFFPFSFFSSVQWWWPATGGILRIWRRSESAGRWRWCFWLRSCWFMVANLAIDARDFFLCTFSFIWTTSKRVLIQRWSGIVIWFCFLAHFDFLLRNFLWTYADVSEIQKRSWGTRL